jgi:hypothetical protein
MRMLNNKNSIKPWSIHMSSLHLEIKSTYTTQIPPSYYYYIYIYTLTTNSYQSFIEYRK